jgi:hypothetical protein
MRKIVIAKALVLAVFCLYLAVAAIAGLKVHNDRVSTDGTTSATSTTN